LSGKVRELNYKTVRYLGHRKLVSFLVNDLQLINRREVLKDILEHSVPVTFQDVVITFCTVTGRRKGQLVQISDARKIYSRKIGTEVWSGIQITTAAGICAMIDAFCAGQLPRTGFVCQEEIPLNTFLNNRFGEHFKSTLSPDEPE
jgi:saccharopine dehydrogenase-like NADP-dependent oxidoreductase